MEARVEGEHDRDAVGVVHGGVDQVERLDAEQHAHGGHVVDQARHQVAGVLALVIRHWQALQMGEEIGAQIALDVAPDVEHQRARERARDRLRDRDGDDRRRRRAGTANGAPAWIASMARFNR
ncbi:MAG: hypothetical protein U0802_11310 [Candidatus Binatia bacterium]